MNFDKLEQAIIRYRESLARFRDDREALRALGVTDLPSDALNSPKSSDGSDPLEPTNEMLRRAVDTAREVGEPVQAGTMHAALSAALAAAPKPAPAPAPGSLPLEPTDEMVEAGRCRDGDGDAYGAGMVREILRAALAAAPRVEVPEVTEEDVMAYRDARNKAEKVEERYENAQLIALAAVRSRLIDRMGAKS